MICIIFFQSSNTSEYNVNYLIDNSFVEHNGKVYRQIIGIPMGTNAGPQIANIFLHVYEFDYIKALQDSRDDVNLKKNFNSLSHHFIICQKK